MYNYHYYELHFHEIFYENDENSTRQNDPLRKPTEYLVSVVCCKALQSVGFVCYLQAKTDETRGWTWPKSSMQLYVSLKIIGCDPHRAPANWCELRRAFPLGLPDTMLHAKDSSLVYFNMFYSYFLYREVRFPVNKIIKCKRSGKLDNGLKRSSHITDYDNYNCKIRLTKCLVWKTTPPPQKKGKCKLPGMKQSDRAVSILFIFPCLTIKYVMQCI